MTPRRRLHELVDAMPERELETAAHVLAGLALPDPEVRARALAAKGDEGGTELCVGDWRLRFGPSATTMTVKKQAQGDPQNRGEA